MLTCNSNRLPIRSTTRAFFQIDMVPCIFLVWPRYLGNANLICGMRDCTQIVNQTIDLCECFSKGLRMTCCISQCSLGVYFTDSDTGIYSKGVRDMRAFCVIVIGKTTCNLLNTRLRTVVFHRHSCSLQLSLRSKLEFPSIM